MAQRKKATESVPSWKEMLSGDTDFLTEIVRSALQDVLEAEMDETLQASKSERTPQRLGYRSGYYARSLVTRVGTIELRVPQDRQGHFSTLLFERYQFRPLGPPGG